MRALLKRLLAADRNEQARIEWVKTALAAIPAGGRLLDAGAGEQRYRQFCKHLQYVAQDFGQYDGAGNRKGLHSGNWDYTGVDIVCDIADIPEPPASFAAILCTEVLEHVPDPARVLGEFSRLLQPGGTLVLTAPFASLVHFAPYFFATGFSRYWYEHHLPAKGFRIEELTPNGDWYDVLYQETMRLPQLALRENLLLAPFAAALLLALRFRRLFVRGNTTADIATLGFHCVARKL